MNRAPTIDCNAVYSRLSGAPKKDSYVLLDDPCILAVPLNTAVSSADVMRCYS